MKLEHAKLIVQAADDMGVEVTLYEGYSGRGMYGKTTTGVVGSHRNLIKSIAYAAFLLGQDNPDAGDAFMEDMGVAFDNMGHDTIIY